MGNPRITVHSFSSEKALGLSAHAQHVTFRSVMKPLIFALCVVFGCGGLSSQTPAWQPSPGHTQVPIWPGVVPDAQPVTGPEESGTVVAGVGSRKLVAA